MVMVVWGFFCQVWFCGGFLGFLVVCLFVCFGQGGFFGGFFFSFHEMLACLQSIYFLFTRLLNFSLHQSQDLPSIAHKT